MSQIQAVKKKFSVDYSETPLPALFVDEGTDDISVQYEWFSPAGDQGYAAFIQKAEQTLLVAANLLAIELISNIQQAIDARNLRVYLCLGDKEQNHEAIDKLSDRCLIRTGVTQQGQLFIRDPNTSHSAASIFLDKYRVKLSKQQTDDAYRSFCKLFWEEAELEHFAGNEGIAQKIEQQIVTNHGYHIADGLTGYWQNNQCSILCQTGGRTDGLITEAHATVVTSADNHHWVNELVENEACVALSEHKLPCIVKDQESIWLLPSSVTPHQVNWGIQLDSTQATDIESLLEELSKHAKWLLKREQTIADIVDKQLLFADDTTDPPVKCLPERTQDLKDIYCQEMNDFLTKPAETLAEKQTQWKKEQLATQITYNVKVHPFYLPKNAEKDDLVTAWEKIEQKWRNEIQHLRSVVERTKKEHENFTTKIFKNLIFPFVKGKYQEIKTIDSDLDILEAKRASKSTLSERIEMSDTFEEIANKINILTKETSSEKRYAEEQQKWTEEKGNLERQLERANELLKTEKDKKNQAIAELEGKLDIIKKERERLKTEQSNDTKSKIEPEGAKEQLENDDKETKEMQTKEESR